MTDPNAAIQEHLRREGEALLDKNPDWRQDPQKGLAEMAKLRQELMAEYGYSTDQLDTIPNHRNVEVARDALAYRKQQAKAGAETAKHKRLASIKSRNDNLKTARGSKTVGDAADAIVRVLDNK